MLKAPRRRRFGGMGAPFRSQQGWLALSLALPVLAVPVPARAALCSTLYSGNAPTNVLFAGGSAAGMPILQSIANALGSTTAIVYLPESPCAAARDLAAGTAETLLATAAFLDPSSGTAASCDVMDQQLDLVVSDVYASTCTENVGVGGLTAMESDFLGPIQVQTLAVPKASTETAISAEAAYVVFGFGGADYTVSPWTDPPSIFLPPTDAGTLLLSVAIGLSAPKWDTTFPDASTPSADGAPPPGEPAPFATSAALVKALSGAKKTSAAIGIVPAQAIQYASPQPSLRILAYQQPGQECGYIPDSDTLHLDKINVRQGRYELWGPLHFVTSVEPLGRPIDHTGTFNPALAGMIQSILAIGPDPLATQAANQWAAMPGSGALAEDPGLLVDGAALSGLVPWCAMQVTRDAEMAEEASFQPAVPCGCRFEGDVGSTLSYCEVCTADIDCSAFQPKCRFGFCEAN